MNEGKRMFAVGMADAIGVLVALLLLPLLWWADLEMVYRVVLAVGPAFSVRMGIRRFLEERDITAGIRVFSSWMLACFLILLVIRYRGFLMGLGLIAESGPAR